MKTVLVKSAPWPKKDTPVSGKKRPETTDENYENWLKREFYEQEQNDGKSSKRTAY